jgi:hypothetical protein
MNAQFAPELILGGTFASTLVRSCTTIPASRPRV